MSVTEIPPLDLNREYLEDKTSLAIQKAILASDIDTVHDLEKKYHSDPTVFSRLVSMVDHREITPLRLSLLVRDKATDTNREKQLAIIKILLQYGADPKQHDSNKWRPLDEAIFLKDSDCLEILFDHLVEAKATRRLRSMRKAASFLSDYEDNFTLSFKWHVKVPLLSSFTPKDSCKVYKYGNKLRSDYSFSDFKNMRMVKENMSSLFDGDTLQYDRIYWDRRLKIDIFDRASKQEKTLMIKDLLEGKKVDGQVKMGDYNIKEATTFFGKPVFEMIEGYKCKKYQVDLKLSFDSFIKKRRVFTTLDPETYLAEDPLPFVEELIESNKVVDTKKAKKIMENTKKIKANIWIAEDYPMNTNCFQKVIDSLGEANELVQKVKMFLKNDKIQEILSKNGFPLKIEIPFNMVISVTVNFFDFKKVEHGLESVFEPAQEVRRVPKSQIIDLTKDDKRRLGYINFAI